MIECVFYHITIFYIRVVNLFYKIEFIHLSFFFLISEFNIKLGKFILKLL